MSLKRGDWLFDEAKNAAVITTRQIVNGGQPILFVSHDVDDGSWQFLAGGTPSAADAMLVALHEIVELDPSVRELADLPCGWIAERESLEAPWKRSPYEE